MSSVSRFTVSAEENQLDRYHSLLVYEGIAQELGIKGRLTKGNLVLALADYGAKKLEEAYKEEVYAAYYAQEGEKLRRESQARARRLGRDQKTHGIREMIA